MIMIYCMHFFALLLVAQREQLERLLTPIDNLEQ